jgi:hypothetical protein
MSPGLAQRSSLHEQFGTKVRRKRATVQDNGWHADAVSPPREAYLESVRRETRIGRGFGVADFERALNNFRELYHVRPEIARCSPDVLERLYALLGYDAQSLLHQEIFHDGLPIVAAVLAPGIIAFEGEVDEDRMGDW